MAKEKRYPNEIKDMPKNKKNGNLFSLIVCIFCGLLVLGVIVGLFF